MSLYLLRQDRPDVHKYTDSISNGSERNLSCDGKWDWSVRHCSKAGQCGDNYDYTSTTQRVQDCNITCNICGSVTGVGGGDIITCSCLQGSGCHTQPEAIASNFRREGAFFSSSGNNTAREDSSQGSISNAS